MEAEISFQGFPAMEDQKPTHDVPVANKPAYPVTKTLLAINLVVYVITAIVALKWKESSNQFVWALGNWGPFTLGGQWWRLLSSTFVHVGFGHLFGNLLFLWILGKRSEQIFGKRVFLFIYLSCGLISSLTSVAIHPELASGGASGPLFGLAGCLIATGALKVFTLSWEGRLKLLLLGLWTVYSIYPDPKGIMDNAAHAGGLITGLVLGALPAYRFAGTKIHLRQAIAGTAIVFIFGCISVRYHNRYVIPLKLAIRAMNKNRADDALPAINAALQKNPNSLLANVLAAEAYLKKKDYPNAGVSVHRALTIDPKNNQATYLLGLWKLHTGYCEEAHDIGASLTGSLGREAWALLRAPCDLAGSGDRAFSEGKLVFAETLYKQAMHANPNDYRSRFGLAKIYQAKGMSKEAAEASAEAKRIQAANPDQ
ncbi:MAG TPA: rhomboid family intramembrane serine protease [Candidatus Angelobacter sp.]|nr:rhomboid family intramembrane serine protease [Candidatus Angelobacter sp.]